MLSSVRVQVSLPAPFRRPRCKSNRGQNTATSATKTISVKTNASGECGIIYTEAREKHGSGYAI